MLIGMNLHKKNREVSVKTRSPPAYFSFNGQATKLTTAKWSIKSMSGHFVPLNEVSTHLITSSRKPLNNNDLNQVF